MEPLISSQGRGQDGGRGGAASDLEGAITRLKRERDAVFLAHYYRDSEIRDLADFVGDSLLLSQAAQKTQARVILFAGVHFMAETAKILNPSRTVLVPDLEASCSLADGCPPESWRRGRPNIPATSRSAINCSAAVKAMSGLHRHLLQRREDHPQLPADQPILFAPDQHLGAT